MRFRRDAEEEGGVIESIKGAERDVEEAIGNAEQELEEAVAPIAETVGMEPWMMLAGIATVVLVLIGVGIWCAWRFFKKKRPAGTAEMEDDEKDLVGNEEEVAEEIEDVQQNTDYKGKIHYRLEYDFTTQELKVTIIECSELPPTDWSTGLTDPFVKVYLLPDKKPN